MNDHPIRIHVRDDLHRSRLTVFFRPLLVVPHVFWLLLWAIPVFILFPFMWLTALVIGRLPAPIHHFYCAYFRYAATVAAFAFLTANPFPGFTGTPGRYPVELELPPDPAKQGRLGIFFRGLLAYPAAALAGAVGGVAELAVFGGWWAALFTGHMPRGLRDVTAYYVRYSSQVNGYFLLLTGTYPNSSPVIGTLIEPPLEPAAATPMAPPPAPPVVPPAPVVPSAPAPQFPVVPSAPAPEPAPAPEQAPEAGPEPGPEPSPPES
ncbi:MAG: DUF4389 domain-containing protein [Gaiellaceae bacterium]